MRVISQTAKETAIRNALRQIDEMKLMPSEVRNLHQRHRLRIESHASQVVAAAAQRWLDEKKF